MLNRRSLAAYAFLALAILLPTLAPAQSTVEDRVKDLERRVSELEAKLNELTTPKSGTAVRAGESVVAQPIALRLTDKTFRAANYQAGTYEDRIALAFEFTNNLQKEIRAFTGTVVFMDLFDREILRVNLTIEQRVEAGGNGTWEGGIDYNQFMDEHNRLRVIEGADLVVGFELKMVMYSDGTREKYGD